MISFEKEKKIFKLDTPNTSYVMSVYADMYLGNLYYGGKIDDADVCYMYRQGSEQIINEGEKSGFMNGFPFEFPTAGMVNSQETCMDIRNSRGQNGIELVYKSHEIYKGKKALKGLPASFGDNCDSIDIILTNEKLGIDVVLTYTAFNDVDIITRSVKVINNSSENINITKMLSAALTLDYQEGMKIIDLKGCWSRERHIVYENLHYGSFVNESLRGESGHQTQPFVAVATGNITQTTGEVYAMHFIYSGNFLGKIQINEQDSLRMVMGIHPDTFEWKLEPGDSFQAPEVVLNYSSEGLGKMSRNFHDFYRNHLIRSKYLHEERPVLVNNWEATYFDFTSDKLVDIAREASKRGIEMLVMDDGWFGKRNSDDGSLGDWFVNEDKIKGGLKKLSDDVHSLGLKFGIWVEPEMISPKSELYKKHPDWAMQTHHSIPVQARKQLNLDLTNPAVVDYIKTCLKDIMEQAPIEYMKWDMNKSLTDYGSEYLPADRQGEVAHRYVLALYEIQEYLVSSYPDLLLENCSSGGARFDPGMLYYSPQIWCSDDMDPVERLSIIEGTALLYPFSAIGAHVSKNTNDILGRTTNMADRAIMALLGTYGYELDITKLTDEEKEAIPDQIKTHKRVEDLVREGDYYRLESYNENHLFDAVEIVSKDKDKVMVVMMQVLCTPCIRDRRIKLQGLNPDYTYVVNGQKLHGSTLMNAGIIVPRPRGDYKATLLEIEKAY